MTLHEAIDFLRTHYPNEPDVVKIAHKARKELKAHVADGGLSGAFERKLAVAANFVLLHLEKPSARRRRKKP
jgi:hypothetical protein